MSRKIITSHIRAERRRHKVSGPLGLAGRLWPSDDNDDDIYIMVECMYVCMSVTFLLISLGFKNKRKSVYKQEKRQKSV